MQQWSPLCNDPQLSPSTVLPVEEHLCRQQTHTQAVLGLGYPFRAGHWSDINPCLRSLALLQCNPTNTPSVDPVGPLPGCVHHSSGAWQRSHCSLVIKQLPAPMGHRDPFGRLQPQSRAPKLLVNAQIYFAGRRLHTSPCYRLCSPSPGGMSNMSEGLTVIPRATGGVRLPKVP